MSPMEKMQHYQQHVLRRSSGNKRIPFSVLIDTVPPELRPALMHVRRVAAARVIMRALKQEQAAKRAWNRDLGAIYAVQDIMAQRMRQKTLFYQSSSAEAAAAAAASASEGGVGNKRPGGATEEAVVVDRHCPILVSPDEFEAISKAAAAAAAASLNSSSYEDGESFTFQVQHRPPQPEISFTPLRMVRLSDIAAKRERERAEAERVEAQREEKRRLAVLAHREELSRQIHAVRLMQRVGRGMLRRVDLGSQLDAFLLTGKSFARLSYVIRSARAAGLAGNSDESTGSVTGSARTTRAGAAPYVEDVWEVAHREILGRVLARHPDWERAQFYRHRQQLVYSVTQVQAMLRHASSMNVTDYKRSRWAVQKLERWYAQCKLRRAREAQFRAREAELELKIKERDVRVRRHEKLRL